MTQAINNIIRNRIVLAALFIGIAGIASAGAPGPYEDGAIDRSVMLMAPTASLAPAPQLSPAEIRNAVSIRMDRAADQGVVVDRASVDGIGLDVVQQERLVEAPLQYGTSD